MKFIITILVFSMSLTCYSQTITYESGYHRVTTPSGVIDIGAKNGSWAHIYTNRPAFIFDKPVWVIGGILSSYSSSNLFFQTHGTTRMTLLKSNGNVGIGTTSPTSVLHVTGTTYDGSPNVAGTQIREAVIEMTSDGGTPFIDFQNDINGTDYDARIMLSGDNDLRIYGASLKMMSGNIDLGDQDIRNIHGIFPKDWDDNSGGSDNKYRLFARDGAFMFYDGGVVVGGYGNGTWSDVPTGTLIAKQSIGIGTTTIPSGYKLAVDGKIIAEEVKVQVSSSWPDFVFSPTYDLRSLEETEAFIIENKHLPEMPSAEEVEENGIQLGEMNALLLKKIEELTLYTIEQQKLIEEQGRLIEQILNKKD